jgi:hypothetical protein
MSLPILMQSNENYGQFEFINEGTVDDGYGGYTTAYTAGATFDAVLVLNDSIQAQKAEQDGVKGVYTLTTDKAVPLAWHKIFRRKGTNDVYRVTSKDEHATPSTTPMNLREVKAEEYVLSGAVKDNG